MDIHADKIQESKSQSVSNDEVQIHTGSDSTFQFVDNRPDAVAQRKLQEIANKSPRVAQLKAFQEMADNSPEVKRITQLQAMADSYSASQQLPIQRQENKTGLPDQLKSGMESVSGLSLSDVKVHRNSDKPAQLQAHAYAQGTDIHLGPGQEKHLPHELGHVVQQKKGRVKPTMQLKGKVNINDDAGLEKEADVLGAKALQGKFVAPSILQKVENNFSSKLPAQLIGGAAEEFDPLNVFDHEEDAQLIGEVEEDFNPLNLFVHGEDKFFGYMDNFNLFLEELIKLDLSKSNLAKENLQTLERLEHLSRALNVTGLVLGLAAVGVFSTVTAGLGPAAVAVGAIGTFATTMEVGIVASALGLGTGAAQTYVKTKDKLKTATPGLSTAQEISLNLLGNDVAGVANAAGKSAGMSGGVGAAASLGGVLAAQLGGVFSAVGLYGNRKAFQEFAAAKKSLMADFTSISQSLKAKEKELIRTSSQIQGTAHASQISEEDQIRIVSLTTGNIAKIGLALTSIQKSLGPVKKSPDLPSKYD